jgi:hypothetical protein
MRLPHIFLATLLSASAGLACAQAVQVQPPNQQNAQKSVDSAMESMMPMLAKMAEVQLESQLKVAEKPATAERIAAFKKNLFDALRKKGFTAEEALQITVSTGLPSVPALGK